MAAKKTNDLSAIVRILDHHRTRCTWVLTVTAGKDVWVTAEDFNRYVAAL